MMSKDVVFILDKIVWILLIAAVTTQALQIAGVVDTPKGLDDFTHNQKNEYNFKIAVDGSNIRNKRQVLDRSPFIDSLFNIPISTLTAVGNLVQSSRPAFQSFREFAQRRFSKSENKEKESRPKNETIRRERSYPVYIKLKEEKN